MNNAVNPTERFSNRVENYRRFRPSYPAAVIDLIIQTARLNVGDAVADVGSGTGIFTRLLLDAGLEVFAIEPNAPMRAAAMENLASFPRFHSIAAPGEATGLADQSVRAITSAQAFHWFDRAAARKEFARLLVPDGWVFLIWNERRKVCSPFQAEYNALLKTLGQEYEGVRNRAMAAGHDFDDFFARGSVREAHFDNPQRMSWEILRGRFLSSSYVPTTDDPRNAGLLAELEAIFRRHAQAGEVVFDQQSQRLLRADDVAVHVRARKGGQERVVSLSRLSRQGHPHKHPHAHRACASRPR